MADTAPYTGIPLLTSGQSDPQITHNEAIVLIQALLNGVIDKDLTAPPGSPAEGDTYIVGASATGAWAGQDDHIATYYNGAWLFLPGNDDSGSNLTIGANNEGLEVFVRDEEANYIYTGSPLAWSKVQAAGIGVMSEFNAFVSSNILNVTGDATAYDVIFDSEKFDTNGDFNTTTGVFTAPVSGVYMFTCVLSLDDLDADTYNTQTISIDFSDGDAAFSGNRDASSHTPGGVGGGGATTIKQMNAGDTAHVSLIVNGGTQSVDIIGNADGRTFFAGKLLEKT